MIWLPPPPASGVTRDYWDMSHTPGQILQLKKREGPPVNYITICTSYLLQPILDAFLVFYIPEIYCHEVAFDAQWMFLS